MIEPARGRSLREGRQNAVERRRPPEGGGRRKMRLGRGCRAAGGISRDSFSALTRRLISSSLDQSANGFRHALELLQDSVGGTLVHEAPLGGEEGSPRGDLRAGENFEGVLELVDLELPGLLALVVVLDELVALACER